MSLEGLLDEPKPSYPRTPCGVKRLLDAFTDQPDDVKTLDALLWKKNPEREGWLYSAAVVADKLRSRGYTIGSQQIGKHRRHDCSCDQ